MDETQAIVYVIDDDAAVREAIGSLCRSTGLQTKLFASTEEFTGPYLQDGPACLVLDVRFPGTAATGLEFQRTLADTGVPIPIVFVSGHADVLIAVEAMKRGAIEFLTKPFREQELLDAIRHGIERDRARRQRENDLAEAKGRVGALTPREYEIMLLMAEGLLGKQIAAKLGVSEITVKVHRARMLKKLDVRSPVELIRLVDRMTAAEAESHSVHSVSARRAPSPNEFMLTFREAV